MVSLIRSLLLLALALPCFAGVHDGHVMPNGIRMSTVSLTLPTVPLVRHDGVRLTLPQALDDGRPTIVSFIYTTCTTVCPVTSQTLLETRARLGAERDKVNMVSISIDPENDRPAKLAAYAKRYSAYGVWNHYTGTTADVITLQRAFGVWRGDKMNHQPVTFVRLDAKSPWTRFDGFVSPTDLVNEYVRLTNGLACAEEVKQHSH